MATHLQTGQMQVHFLIICAIRKRNPYTLYCAQGVAREQSFSHRAYRQDKNPFQALHYCH